MLQETIATIATAAIAVAAATKARNDRGLAAAAAAAALVVAEAAVAVVAILVPPHCVVTVVDYDYSAVVVHEAAPCHLLPGDRSWQQPVAGDLEESHSKSVRRPPRYRCFVVGSVVHR